MTFKGKGVSLDGDLLFHVGSQEIDGVSHD